MEVGKPRSKKHRGLLFLAALALLVLAGVRVGIALVDTGGEEARTVDVDRVLFLSPAPPLPTPTMPSPAAVVAPTPSPTPTPVVIPVATPSPTPSPTPVVTPVATPTPELPELQTMQVALTFYTCPPFCLGDLMANTLPLHAGAMACGYALDTGQRFQFDGAEYVCEDRGLGPYQWLDFWQPTDAIGRAWQARVGMTGTITLLGSGE